MCHAEQVRIRADKITGPKQLFPGFLTPTHVIQHLLSKSSSRTFLFLGLARSLKGASQFHMVSMVTTAQTGDFYIGVCWVPFFKYYFEC